MPSISVPLAGTKRWDELQKTRKEFWRKPANNKLTEHFKATEMFCHDGSAPPTKARPAMVKLCEVFLEPLRKKFGTAYVLSGYRHQLYNARIGGVTNSEHVYEHTIESAAADMRFQRGSPAEWATEAKKIRAKHGGDGGVGQYNQSGFVHVDNRTWQADWSG